MATVFISPMKDCCWGCDCHLSLCFCDWGKERKALYLLKTRIKKLNAKTPKPSKILPQMQRSCIVTKMSLQDKQKRKIKTKNKNAKRPRIQFYNH